MLVLGLLRFLWEKPTTQSLKNNFFSFIVDITVEQLNQRLKGHGELYVHGRDKDAKVLMVFAVKKHIKGTENMDDMKKFFLYMLERIDR